MSNTLPSQKTAQYAVSDTFHEMHHLRLFFCKMYFTVAGIYGRDCVDVTDNHGIIKTRAKI